MYYSWVGGPSSIDIPHHFQFFYNVLVSQGGVNLYPLIKDAVDFGMQSQVPGYIQDWISAGDTITRFYNGTDDNGRYSLRFHVNVPEVVQRMFGNTDTSLDDTPESSFSIVRPEDVQLAASNWHQAVAATNLATIQSGHNHHKHATGRRICGQAGWL